MLAIGAAFGDNLGIFGAKTWIKKSEINRASHTADMESTKLLFVNSEFGAAERSKLFHVRILNDYNIVRGAKSKCKSALHQLLLSDFTKTVGIACASVLAIN